MLRLGLVDSLLELPGPVLTVYLNTDRSKSVNRTLKPGYLTSLKSQAKLAEESLHPEDREPFREQVECVRAYLGVHPPQSKGIAVFAGHHCWEFVSLKAEVEDEVHWGAPNPAQLLWLMDEHRPYGIVVVNRKRAQFFLYWLGDMLPLEEKEFTLPPSKRKEMGPVARSFGVRVSRGTNRDVYEHHRAAQYSRYYRQIAKDIEGWCDAEHLQSLFLLGLAEAITAIQKEISLACREKIVFVEEDLVWVSRAELRRRIEPLVAKHERERESGLIDALLGDHRGLVVGMDETLARLQQGKVRTLVVIKNSDASLKRCGQCLWVDRTTDPICPACGGERHNVSLREVLPELARRYTVSVEVVSGEAGRRLQEAGGIGAWLREFERKEYGEHLAFR
jgi:Bacterial archaeo-eukaryotic release factor family 10